MSRASSNASTSGAPRPDRWHLHFTSQSSSWLNHDEGRLSLLTAAGFERLHLGRESRHAIEAWAEHWTDHTKPFVWETAADGIIIR